MSTESFRAPATVWSNLVAGNKRFSEGRPEHPHTDGNRREELTEGQNPKVVVLACSDSRVPVELIFDVGFGDVFVVRTAGEIIDPSVLASVEYALSALDIHLLVVVGHESCGAVSAAVSTLESGEVPDDWQRVLVEKVSSSVLSARREGFDNVEDFERVHVRETVVQLFHRLTDLAGEVEIGRVGVVGARYRLSDGLVEPVVSFGV